jgi:signal transduction histidine kinase
MKFISILITSLILLTAPLYHAHGQTGLKVQTYQQDTATINRLLISAKKKRFSDSTTALKECREALVLSQKHNDAENIYRCYHRLARIHEVNNQEKKAHPYFLAELSVENKVSDKTKHHIYSEVAQSYMFFGDNRMAYEYLIKLYQLGESTNNIDILQQGCLFLGKFYLQVNDFEKATEYLVRSVDLSVQINDPDEICDSYRILSGVYVKSKNYDLAIKCSEKSILYVDKIDNYTFARYFVYTSHGGTLAECGKVGEAIKTLNKSVELCKEVDDKSALAATYVLMADTYSKINKLDSAEHYFSKCMLLTSAMSETDMMNYQLSYGQLLSKKGEYGASISLFKKSIAIATKFDVKLKLQQNYAHISDAYERIGNKDLSLFFVKKALTLRDSIYSEENTRRTAEAQFKYDLAHSEEQLKVLENRQTYTIVGGLFILLCFAVAFLSYFLRSKNEKNRLLVEQTEVLKEKTHIIDNKNRQLEESNEVLRQFAFASAHDLKEPLRSINSFTNILQKRYMKDAPPEAHEYMGFVTSGVRRMESLLNALLEFSSVLTDENVPHQNNEILLILNDIFQRCDSLIQEKKAVIKGPSVFPTISMNEAHLKQILFNLVHNALKFSKTEAKIAIDYSINDDEFILSVKDAGIGMDASYGDKIFKLFQRLDRVTHKESAGIGLSISKNIMDKYEGRIWFDSVINEGTTFYLVFPKSMISKIPVAKEAPQYLEYVAADLSAELPISYSV